MRCPCVTSIYRTFVVDGSTSDRAEGDGGDDLSHRHRDDRSRHVEGEVDQGRVDKKREREMGCLSGNLLGRLGFRIEREPRRLVDRLEIRDV